MKPIDYYTFYPKRIQLLDNDSNIEPDKWVMEIEGLTLIGVDMPIFEEFYLDENILVSKTHAVDSKVISISSKLNSMNKSYILNFLTNEVLNIFKKYGNNGMIATKFFIYSFLKTYKGRSHLMNYELRWAPSNIQTPISILREKKLRQLLGEE